MRKIKELVIANIKLLGTIPYLLKNRVKMEGLLKKRKRIFANY